MRSAFDFIERADYRENPIHLACYHGKVFVLEETSRRPRTCELVNIDNLDGEDPDPSLVAFEDLPAGLRADLKSRNIRFRTVSASNLTIEGAMG